ncbi:FAD/NAD(P)-binding domain-containing protein [Xylariaceae sp. FL0594]|nr:FAD/NAD(P)-binding domain-containing protein [Xylariaceae sp. FL0594]
MTTADGEKTKMKKIVILGGSYGGVSTAHYVLKHVIPKLPDATSSYQVVLVNTASQAMCRPAAPRALISDSMFDRQEERLFVSIRDSFAAYAAYPGKEEEEGGEEGEKRFVFEHGTATALDIENRVVTPAGELGEHLNGRPGIFPSFFSSPSPKVRITLLSGGPRILPYLRASMSAAAESYLSRVGVRVVHNTRVASVKPATAGFTVADVASSAVLTLDNGEVWEDVDLYIPAVGATPNTAFVPPSLLDADGRVRTDPATLRVIIGGAGAAAGVYAIGDASSAARPSIHNITSMIPVLSANIRRDLLLAAGSGGDDNNNNDKSGGVVLSPGEDRLFKEDTRMTQLVPIGRSKGVGAIMGFKVPSFFVWLIKGRDYWLWTTGNLWSGKQWAKES